MGQAYPDAFWMAFGQKLLDKFEGGDQGRQRLEAVVMAEGSFNKDISFKS